MEIFCVLLGDLISFGVVILGEYFYVFSGYDGDVYGFVKELLNNYFCCIKYDDLDVEWEEFVMYFFV